MRTKSITRCMILALTLFMIYGAFGIDVVNAQTPPTCRTPGFWGLHAGTEKSGSNNITQEVITDCGGCLSICGESVTNTAYQNASSAVEAMCVSPAGDIRQQLARQLTAASLNCCVSGGGSDCAGLPTWGFIFSGCNFTCAEQEAEGYQPCIDALDCLNNGGNVVLVTTATGTEVACQTGTCQPLVIGISQPINEPCGENLPACPEGFACVPLEDTCHTRVLGVCTDGSICTVDNTTDGLCNSDGSVCTPGPAGSSDECSAAIQGTVEGTGRNRHAVPNYCSIIPKPSSGACSDKNQGEECCTNLGVTTCDGDLD